jgi:hypothetical protein
MNEVDLQRIIGEIFLMMGDTVRTSPTLLMDRNEIRTLLKTHEKLKIKFVVATYS